MKYILLAILCLFLFLLNVIFDKKGSENISGILSTTVKAGICTAFLIIYIFTTGFGKQLFVFTNKSDIGLVILFGLSQAANWFLYFVAIKKSKIEQFSCFNELQFLLYANIWTLVFNFNNTVNPTRPISLVVYVIGLLVFVVASIIAVLSKDFDIHETLKWIMYDAIACLLGSFYLIVSGLKLTTIPVEITTFYFMAIVFICGIIVSLLTGEFKKIGEFKHSNLTFLSIGAIVNSLEIVFRLKANTIEGANIAIINVIVSSCFVFLTLVNVFVKKQKFPKAIWIAFILLILGMILNSVALYL